MRIGNPLNCCTTNVHLQVVVPQNDFQVVDLRIDLNEKLLKAVKENDVVTAAKALKEGASLYYRNMDGDTALDLGVNNKDKEMTKLIVEHMMAIRGHERFIAKSITIKGEN